ncbi:GntR family transcriptional regulator [Methylobacterium sp. 174MFSha1.1]|uniref:GntR family transcriptional regulator n=1 Tax=Methylobacterium sp. 174MFSha1.1 TaxID=1502749 RepID=UPI0008E80FF6|nr:GntR family transcriptional regulator [Methylobacterium sp. 174MFSha1.1]SFU76142.1 GntR family transcriptional regulator [Methylobacterium sp. 174MFSha1.1]
MTMRSLPQPDLRLPLYQRLRDEIAHQIARNVWRSGEPIPTEAELAATHGVAIGTVRKAIDVLVADGLVERQQGRGTFVRRPRFDRSLFRFFRHLGPDGGQVVPEGRILSRAVRPAPAPVREALALDAGAETIRLTRLRLLQERPILSEEIWLPAERFAPLLAAPLPEIGDLLYPAYERLCSEIVARAEETLTVACATPADGDCLGIPEGAPVVVVERLAFGFDGRPIEWRLTRGAATDFRYRIDIR